MRKKFVVGNFNLKIRKARTGKGLFATDPIPKGSCVIEYVGVLVPEDKIDTVKSRYLFEVGRKKTINGNVPYNKARFINHSCKPNCEADGPSGKVFITTIKNIKAGEELTYDYGEEYFDEYFKETGCMCDNCLKKKQK